jgi:hypothetical protein
VPKSGPSFLLVNQCVYVRTRQVHSMAAASAGAGQVAVCPPRPRSHRRSPATPSREGLATGLHTPGSRDISLAAAKRRKEVVVGIDLGTTNSAVAYIEGGKPKCIPNQAGEKVTPSVVCFTPEGDAVVGRAARRLAASQPANTFYSVKRVIGRTFQDPVVADESKRLAYKVPHHHCYHAATKQWLTSCLNTLQSHATERRGGIRPRKNRKA